MFWNDYFFSLLFQQLVYVPYPSHMAVSVCSFTADEALDFERAANAITVVSCTRKSNAFSKPNNKEERYKQLDIISVCVRRIHSLSMTIRRLDRTRLFLLSLFDHFARNNKHGNEVFTMVYSGCTSTYTIPGVRWTCGRALTECKFVRSEIKPVRVQESFTCNRLSVIETYNNSVRPGDPAI